MSHNYSKHPHNRGNFRIRDETIGKWVTNGVGRQLRHGEEEIDETIEILEERTKDCPGH